MKLLYAILALVPLYGGGTPAQPAPRTVSRSVSVEAFRPVGNTRIWTFVSRDSAVGQLTSTIVERTVLDGHDAVKISEKLSFDYRKIGSELTISTEGDHFVAPQGAYLGDDLSVSIAGQTEALSIRRQGDSVVTTFTRAGSKVSQARYFPSYGLAWDNNFLDQLEILLALRDLTVGDVVIDTVFAAQPMVTSPVHARVDRFGFVRLFEGRSDSCFIITLIEPQQWVLFFTPDKRLVKVEMPGQSTKVYLDLVRQTTQPKPQAARLNLALLSRMIPSYLGYFIITVLALAFYVRGGYRWGVSYIALIVGAILAVSVPWVQEPMQMWLITKWLIPQVTKGGSLYFWGLLPGLAAGLFQTILLLVALFAVVRWRRPSTSRIAVIGAFCGAGIGLLEAGYLGYATHATTVFSFQLLERGSLILFHVTAGLVVGDALTMDDSSLLKVLGITVLVNTFFRYLPVFVQQKALSIEITYFLMSFACLAMVAATLLYRRKAE
ncbi:MAG: hypothetical protein AB1644_07590 [Candidatus Zixiibacteriota bacterium]